MRGKYPSEYFVSKHRHLYLVWKAMIRRCSPGDREDQRYYFYRGVRVCVAWLQWPSFAKFCLENGWKRGLQLDRIDNSIGYYPDNVRFVTAKVQHHNRDLVNTYRHIKEAQTLHWAQEFECIETGERFLTQIEAQRVHGVDRKTLRMCLKGIYEKAGGLHWRYVEAF